MTEVNGYKIKPGANLRDADLSRANLRDADLNMANLIGANLRDADLSRANLSRADLSDANLSRANLRCANLSRADLIWANLRCANLIGADLRDANLIGADLRDASLPHFQICPEEGGFYAFKKVHGGICKMYIPAYAKRTSSLVGRKCRADVVKVVAAPDDNRGMHDPSLKYVVGELIKPDSYDDDIRRECANGIHFFMTRREAEEY